MRYVRAAFSAVAAAGLSLAVTVFAYVVVADRIAHARAVAAQSSGAYGLSYYVDLVFWPHLVVAGVVGVGVFYVRTRKKTSAD